MSDEKIYSLIVELINVLNNIDGMIDSNSNRMQEIDLEINDWLHYIENNEIDEKQSIKIIKELKRLRDIRRHLKNEYEIEKVYKDNYSKINGLNSRPFLLAEINKTKKQLNSNYKNRVLTEDKINEILIVKKRGRPKKENKDE